MNGPQQMAIKIKCPAHHPSPIGPKRVATNEANQILHWVKTILNSPAVADEHLCVDVHAFTYQKAVSLLFKSYALKMSIL